jgi:hypothetical protein
MLSFSKLETSDLALITELRDKSHAKLLLEDKGRNNKLSFAHEVYTIGQDNLKEFVIPGSPSAMRVIETNEAFKFIYDVYPDFGAQMFYDPDFIGKYQQAFELLSHINQEKTDYKVRSIRVPTLYVDAIWLRDDQNESNDKFILIRMIGDFDKATIYSHKEFFNVLRKVAENVQTDDNL